MNTSDQKQAIGYYLAYIQCQKALQTMMKKLNMPIAKIREIDKRNAESFGVSPRYIQ